MGPVLIDDNSLVSANAEVSPERIAKGLHAHPSTMSAKFNRTVEKDQWTVHGNYNSMRPFHVFHLDDGMEIYISARNGRLALATTSWQRFINYPGAIIHWIYFTPIRSRPDLWKNLVVYISLISFLVVILGFIKGISLVRFRKPYRRRRRLPYYGTLGWHHRFGLVFGTFCLTWLLSGLFSMNPWNIFVFEGITNAEGNLIRGERPKKSLVKNFFQIHGNEIKDLQPRKISARWVLGQPLVDVYLPKKAVTIGEFSTGELKKALMNELYPSRFVGIAKVDWNDSYISGSESSTMSNIERLEFDSGLWIDMDFATGRLVAKHSPSSRAYRWLFDGLHRLDLPFLRNYPTFRKFLIILLAIGCLSLAGFGMASYLRLDRWLLNRGRRRRLGPS